jgi:hypothetical protein
VGAEDIDPIAAVVKANTPISNAKPELGRMNAAQSLDVTGAGGGEAVDSSIGCAGR